MAKKLSKPKELDITKTGPAGFKQLQLTNASNYEGLDLDTLDFLKGIKSETDSFTLYDPVRLSEHSIMSPLDNQLTAWGESMFDEETATAELFKNLLDTRADNQPGILLIVNGGIKGAVLAGTTFLLGTVGLAAGLANWASTGEFNKFYDNPFNNTMQLLNEWSEQNIPNYYAEGQQEKPFWEQLGTANFWGDQFLKNIGFTVGAYYSGSVFTKLLSPVIKMSQMAGTSKVLGALNDAKLGKISVAEASELAGKVARTPAIINTGVGSFISAVNEGAIEALNNSKDYKQLEYAKETDDYNNKILLLLAQYGNSEMYSKLEDAINKEHLDNLAKIDAKAQVMGNTDLLLNIPILTLGNAILFGKLYSGGFKTNRKIQNLINRKGVKLQLSEAGKITEDIVQLESKKLTKTLKLLKATNAVRKTSLTEGFEEMNQYAASTTAGNFADKYYSDKNDQEATNIVDNLITSSALGLAEAYSSQQAWNEFFIGALTGALGMPTFGARANSTSNTYLGKGKAIGLSGGIIGQTRVNNEADKDQLEVIDYVNSRVKSPGIFKDYREGLIAHTKALNEMDNAALLGKEMEFLDASFRQLTADVEMFSRVGRTLDLLDMINSAYDTSDANIQAIIDNTKVLTDDGIKSPFMDDKGNVLPKDKIIEKLTKAKDDIINTVDNYTKTLELLDVMYGEALTDKLLLHATWMTMLKDNWKAREDLMSNEIIDYFKPIINNIDSQLNYLNTNVDRLDTLGSNRTAEQDDLYIKALDEIKALENFRDVINSINTTKDTMGVNLQIPIVGKDGKIITLADVINSWFEAGSELSENIFNNNRGTTITTTKEEVALKLKDIVALSNKRNNVDNIIKDYIIHPEKFDESNQRVSNQTVETQNNNARNTSKEILAKATNLKDLRNILLTDYNSLDEFNKGIIDELVKEGNKAAQAYRTVSKKKKNVVDKLNSMDNVSPDDLEAALSLMDRSAQNASNFKEFLDPTNLAMDIDESDIEDYIDKMDKGLVPPLETRELVEQAITDRNLRAKELLLAALNNSDLIETQLDRLEKLMQSGIDFNTDLLDAAIEEAIKNETEKRQLVLSDLELSDIAIKVVDKITKEGLQDTTNSSNLRIKIGDNVVTPNGAGTVSKLTVNGLAIIISDNEYTTPQVVSVNDITEIYDNDGIDVTSSRQVKPDTIKVSDNLETTGNSEVTPTAVVKPKTETNEQHEEVGIEEQRGVIRSMNGDTTVNNNIEDVDDNINLDNTRVSSQTNSPYLYWKSAIAEVPIGSNLPTEQRTMSVLDYLKAKELPLEVIAKYSEQYNLLILAGAFDFIDSGNLNIGQRVYFKYHKSANAALGGFIGMYVNDSNNKKQLIGFLPHPTDAAFSKYPNLLNFYDNINKDGEFSNIVSTVNQILIGKVPYTNQERTLKEIFNTTQQLDNVILGIVKNGRIETGGIIASENILQPMNPKEGQVYVLTPNSNKNSGKNGYSPSAVIFEYDNSNRDDLLVKQVISLINDLLKPTSGRDFIDTILALDEIFYMQDVHFNLYGLDGKELRTPTAIDIALNNNEQITFNIKDSNGFLFKVKDRPLIGNPTKDLVEYIESYIVKNPLNIRLRNINTGNYNQKLLGHLHNNMTNAPHTVGDFFTINPLDVNGLEKKADKIPTTGVNPIRTTTSSESTSETININYAGVNITVNIKSGTGFYIDKLGKTIYVNKGDVYYDSAVAKYLVDSGKVQLDINGLYPVGDLGTGYWDDNIGMFVGKGVKNKFNELSELAKKSITRYLKVNKKDTINSVLDDVADLLQMSITKPLRKNFKNDLSYDSAINRYYFKVRGKLDELMDIVYMNTDDTIKNKTSLGSNIPVDELTYYSELINKLELEEENALDDALIESIKPLEEVVTTLPKVTKKVVNISNDDIEDTDEDLADFINDSNTDDLDTESWRRLDNTTFTLSEATESIEKEIAWLQKVLPLLSTEEHLLLIDGLLRTKDGNNAWGMFKLGVIVLSKSAAPGTLYHESFHSVIRTLISENDFNKYIEAAKIAYNTTNNLEAEEKMAEAFRRYMQIESTPIVGSLIHLFRKVKNFIKGITGQEYVIDKLFYDINNGKYASINPSNVTSRQEVFRENNELATIKSEAIANGTFMKAPNGKATNLSEQQWLLVRTKAFKDWFGDWERVANNSLGNLKGNNDVSEILNNDGTINFNRLEEITNEYFKNADISLFKKGRKTLRERQEKHFDINGNPLEVHTLEHLINVTKSASEIDIKEELKPILILAASLHDIAKPFHRGQRHGFQSVDVINSVFKGNISPLVKFAVRHHMLTLEESKEFTINDAKRIIQDAIDNNLNIQDAIDILLALNTSDIMMGQKPSDIDRYSGKTKKETIEEEIPIKRELLELAAKNLSDNKASKVVDENGEPLVVYHGTEENFNSFNFINFGKNTTVNSPEYKLIYKSDRPVVFFTPDKDYIQNFGEVVKSAFLNIKKLKLDVVQASQLGTYIDNMSLEYDGANLGVNEGTETVDMTDQWLVFNPNQIKSATDNVGTFDSLNDDIRYKEVPNSSFESLDTEEERTILSKAKRDDRGKLLAPNGKPTNLTEAQYVQVRTKAFKEWFGDWETPRQIEKKIITGLEVSSDQDWLDGSTVVKRGNSYFYTNNDGMNIEITKIEFDDFNEGKTIILNKKTKVIKELDTNFSKIVDENGEPLVMYHRSNTDIKVFDISKSRHGGFWFSRNPNYYEDTKAKLSYATPVFLNIKTPNRINHETFLTAVDGDATIEGGIRTTEFDGWITEDKHIPEFYGDEYSSSIVFAMATNPNQIKSATDNVGTFSNESDDIRYREVVEINNYHNNKFNYENLNTEQKDFLKENNISEKLYNKLTNDVRDRMFHCGI